MIQLERLYHQLSGNVPGGLLLLGIALLLLAVLFLKILPGTGIFGDRGPLPALAVGVAALCALFVLAHRQFSLPPAEATILLWPPETVDPRLGCALASICEEHLQERGLPMRVRRHSVIRGLEQDSLALRQVLKASGASELIGGRLHAGGLQLEHLRLKHQVVSLEAGAFLPLDREHSDLQDLLAQYYAFCCRALGIEPERAPDRLLEARHLPLYGMVQDSAAQLLYLEEDFADFRDRLRAADFRLAAARQDYDRELRRVLNEGLANPGNAGSALFLYAATWFAWEGDWDRAIQALDNTLSLEPRHPRAWWIVSKLNRDNLAHFGFREKEQALRKALELQPAYWPALKDLTEWLVDMRRAGEAHALLERALVLCPDHPEILLQAVRSDRSRMSYGSAAQRLDRAEELLPGDVRPFYERGQLYYITGKDSLAVIAFEQAVRMGCPAEALHLLGMSSLQLGDRERARWYFQRRIERGGNPVEVDRSRRQLKRLDREDREEARQEARP